MALPFENQDAPPFCHQLLRDYRASIYACQIYRLRPGHINVPFEKSIAARGHSSYAFLTAYNPYSDVSTPLHINLARAQVLRSVVKKRGYPTLPAAGIDPSGEWPEEVGLMLFDVSLQEALELGAGFGQHAILYGEVGAEPAILWCKCNL